MRYLWGLVLLAGGLAGAELQIDHVTVAGSSLKTLQGQLSAVGIESVYGGAHVNGATEMALVSFPDGGYLELMALQPHADPKAVDEHVWAKFLRENAGPCAFAVREKDIAAEVARLKAAGVTVAAPVRSGRQRPDGVRLEWQTSDVGAELRGTFFPFLIQDMTPRAQRAFPQGKPVTRDFKGIARVVIVVANLEAAVKRYRQAYGLPEPLRQVDKEFGAHLAFLGGSPVVLAQSLKADSWLTERIEKFGEGPVGIVLTGAHTGRYRAPVSTRWMNTKISWLDPKLLGWRLGFEE
jgi:catechol 2,3-dioxygenase-like lactoylglutathione lyase family enzyme